VQQPPAYPVRFSVDYPDRELDRTSTLLRIFYAIPILILFSTVGGGTWTWSSTSSRGASVVAAGAGGLLFFGPLLMIVFRQKYPRRVLRGDRRLVRDPVHRALPARRVRLGRGRHPLVQPGDRLRAGAGHR
jgi:hypothetical protein